MKIMSVLLTGLLAFCFVSPVYAKIVPNLMFKTTDVHFVTPLESKTVDNLTICIVDPIGSTTKVSSAVTENSPYYGEGNYALATMGVNIEFENKGTEAAVISWKNSSISTNLKNYGIPFIEGMKYKDAGNPSATPDTIVAPTQKFVKKVFLPTTVYTGSMFGWAVKGTPIPCGKDFNMILVISVNGKLVTFVTPNIDYIESKK